MRIAISAGLCTLLSGCVFGGDKDGEREELPRAEPLRRLELRAATEVTTDLHPVGVAVAPDGTRYVFDEGRGLFRLDGDRASSLVPLAAMPDPGPMQPLVLPVTDLAALAPNLFALTGIGDGYLLDTSAMTLTQHFCYVPEGTPVTYRQRTDSLAWDPDAQRIYAQPVTFDDANTKVSSQLASYDRATGEDQRWQALDLDVAAGGMFVLRDVGVVLGQGTLLSRVTPGVGDALVPVDNLGRFGVASIDGLAVDAAAGRLVVVDQAQDLLFEIALADLVLAP